VQDWVSGLGSRICQGFTVEVDASREQGKDRV
jgi:hypothetical protein